MTSLTSIVLLTISAAIIPSSQGWIKRFRYPGYCREERLSDQFCSTDDQGVEHIDICDWVGEGPYWEGKGVFKFVRHRTCNQGPFTKCHEHHEVDEKSRSWCIDPTPRPPLPSVGTLRWNGTKMYNDRAYSRRKSDKRVANVYGVAIVDRAGSYFKSNTFVYRWGPKRTRSRPKEGPHIMKTSFIYITPKQGGKYTKYHGSFTSDSKTRNCDKEEVSSTGSMQEEWDLWRNSDYELKSRRHISSNVEEHRWEERLDFDEADSFISWNMTYFKDKGFAIPNTKFQERDDDDGLKWIDRLKFSYEEPIDKMDILDKLPKFCK